MRIRSDRTFALAMVVAVMLGAWGCQNKAKPKTVPESTTPAVEAGQKPPPSEREITQPAAEPFPQTDVDKTALPTATIDELNRQGVLKTVYFGYNSEEIDDAGKAVLQANAAWLKANSGYRVEVGGHCDERGAIGYNVALGDRRAASVKDYLAGLGVSATQLVAVSYGEEKPAATGHDETSWSKNRRADFMIQP